MARRPGDRHATKAVSLRIPPDLWLAVKRKAEDRGETVLTAVIRKLREYVEFD
jgi:hypothetical protein